MTDQQDGDSRKVGGIYYYADTPDAVVGALEHARSTQQRIRLYLGDRTTGRDWLEEHDTKGSHVTNAK